MSRYLQPGQFEIIAHRGGGLEAPENTLAAFQNAVSIFARVVLELDVRRTRDGEIVVIHDPTVDRTTNGTGFVKELTYQEIQKLDAGYRFTPDRGHSFPFRGKGLQIPLFKDIVKAFPNTRISFEIKDEEPPHEEEVLKIIDGLGAADRVVIAAENDRIMKRARRLRPHWCSGYSMGEVRRSWMLSKLGLSFFDRQAGQVYQVPLQYDG